MAELKDFMTVEEFSELLGVTRGAVYKSVRLRKYMENREGKYYVRKEALEELYPKVLERMNEEEEESGSRELLDDLRTELYNTKLSEKEEQIRNLLDRIQSLEEQLKVKDDQIRTLTTLLDQGQQLQQALLLTVKEAEPEPDQEEPEPVDDSQIDTEELQPEDITPEYGLHEEPKKGFWSRLFG